MKKTVLLCFLLLFSITIGPVATAQPIAEPTVSAHSAVVMDALTGQVLYEKNADQKRAMASTTKIMTTLLAVEQADLQRTVTATKEMVQVEGSGMGLQAGDSITLEGLCYGMMLASGNDAANGVAIALGGSLAGFAEKMNQKAALLGMKNTHFVTPSGLDADRHYTTAYDMALLMQAALTNSDFCKIAQSVTAKVRYGDPPESHTLKNHHRLLTEYDGCVGGKTGFTKKAGRCLVTAARRNGATLICVTLSAPDDWQDHKALLDYGFSQMEQVSIPAQAIPLAVVGGTRTTVVLSCPAMQVSVPSAHLNKLSTQLQVSPFLYAPLDQGETVGIHGVFYDGQLLTSQPLTTQEAVAPAPYRPNFWEVFWQRLCRWLIP